MKGILIIVLTFVLAFLTSFLFELEFVLGNWVRFSLVVLLIVCELATGFFVLKGIYRKNNQNQQ